MQINLNRSAIYQKYMAFTLAEVLITLGIIGIVAQMTIPALVSSYQKKLYAVGYKKFETSTNQAFMALLTDSGCDDLSCTDLFPDTTPLTPDQWRVAMETELKKHTKILESSATFPLNKYRVVYKGVSGTPFGAGWYSFDENRTRYTFSYVTADGMIVQLYGGTTPICYAANTLNTTNYKGWCRWGIVDTNGTTPPNSVGRDIQSFHLMSNGNVIPDYSERLAKYNFGDGWASSADYWKNNGTCDPSAAGSNGQGCAARMTEEDGGDMKF